MQTPSLSIEFRAAVRLALMRFLSAARILPAVGGVCGIAQADAHQSGAKTGEVVRPAFALDRLRAITPRLSSLHGSSRFYIGDQRWLREMPAARPEQPITE